MVKLIGNGYPFSFQSGVIEMTRKEFIEEYSERAKGDQFLEECLEVCHGWGFCGWADDNPASCPLINGTLDAAMEYNYEITD